MNDFIIPAAISGVKNPEKIRAVIYANNALAHIPLDKLLKQAVEIAPPLARTAYKHQEKSLARSSAIAKKTENYSGFIRLGGNFLLQYGFCWGTAGTTICVFLPAAFADRRYCAFLSPCSSGNRPFTALIDAESRKPQSFCVLCTSLPFAEKRIVDDYASLNESFFWLALGMTKNTGN